MSILLQSSLDQIEPIAESWHYSGAQSFALWSNDSELKRWQFAPGTSHETITAPVKINNTHFGEIRVCGSNLNQEQALNRLATDAKVISMLLHLENDRRVLSEELVDTRDQLLILSSMSDLTRKVIEMEELLKVLTENAYDLIKADETAILVQNEGQAPIWKFYPHQSLGTECILDFIRRRSPGGYSVFLSEPADLPESCNKNILALPIKISNTQQAALIFIKDNAREFLSYEIKLAKAVADFAGAQIEKINLMNSNIEVARIETEIGLAQKIQESLLLRTLPKVDGLDICLAFQPASRISGDYYDMIINRNEVVDFIIGDISGKGMPAALFMAMTLKVIRSVAVGPSFPSPDIIINQSNQILFKDYNDAVMFSTLFIGQYNTRSREICFSNAGHSPVVYYPAGGKPKMLLADAVPLGLFPDMKCQVNKVRLAPGDILVMATDGINETSNQSKRLFGFTQLMGLVEKHSKKSSAEITNEILEAVKAYGAGKKQEDDRAMIVIKGV
jgi:phosphoserine phosphatase RsbU/P